MLVHTVFEKSKTFLLPPTHEHVLTLIRGLEKLGLSIVKFCVGTEWIIPKNSLQLIIN